MYFARRRRMFTGMRDGGAFVSDGRAVVDMKDRLGVWEGANKQALGRMVELLRQVRERVGVWKGVGVRRFSLVCRSDGLGERGVCKTGLYARVDGVVLLPETTGVEGWDDTEDLSDVTEEYGGGEGLR
jgi:hypothetical protein